LIGLTHQEINQIKKSIIKRSYWRWTKISCINWSKTND
jgi:hypothetical protein